MLAAFEEWWKALGPGMSVQPREWARRGWTAGRLEGIREAIAALPGEITKDTDAKEGFNLAIEEVRAALTAKLEERDA
jgi:hypothetical protein